MAGFEVIVRPVVFPNIRPAPTRALAPEDTPEQGIAVLGGSGGRLIDLTVSESSSWSRQHLVEKQRKFDRVRIPYTRPDGTFDYSRYIEVEVAKKVDFFDGGTETAHQYAQFEVGTSGAEIVQRDVVRRNPAS